MAIKPFRLGKCIFRETCFNDRVMVFTLTKMVDVGTDDCDELITHVVQKDTPIFIVQDCLYSSVIQTPCSQACGQELVVAP